MKVWDMRGRPHQRISFFLYQMETKCEIRSREFDWMVVAIFRFNKSP